MPPMSSPWCEPTPEADGGNQPSADQRHYTPLTLSGRPPTCSGPGRMTASRAGELISLTRWTAPPNRIRPKDVENWGFTSLA